MAEYFAVRHTPTDYFGIWERFIDEHSLLTVQEITKIPTQNDSSHNHNFPVF